MYKKSIISEFFTTINFKIYLKTLALITYKLPALRYGKSTSLIENKILSYIWKNKSEIISLYNWRSAIYRALKILKVKKNDEVIVPWYTCVSVSNAVIQSWAKIVYSDISKTNLWLDPKKLAKTINKNTKAIIVQHTFWKASEIKKISKLAKENKIIIIEDCAHSLWTRKDDEKLWSFWDFAIFSTGRDKVISSVTGGFLVINNKNYFKEIKKVKSALKMPSIWLTLRNLFYNLSWYEAYKTYDFFKLWKVIITLARKTKLITEILTKEEKNCNFKKFNLKLPNSLAYLASESMDHIKIDSIHRRSIAEYYDELIINKNIKKIFWPLKTEKVNYFRYPILLKTEAQKIELYNYMRKNWVILWNTWSWINIAPIWSNLKKAKYEKWSCPTAEDISSRILTLPNHTLISPDDAKKVTLLLNNFKK